MASLGFFFFLPKGSDLQQSQGKEEKEKRGRGNPGKGEPVSNAVYYLQQTRACAF